MFRFRSKAAVIIFCSRQITFVGLRLFWLAIYELAVFIGQSHFSGMYVAVDEGALCVIAVPL